MITLKVYDQQGDLHRISGEVGRSLMETVRDAGVEISSVCGGTCSCGTCHVFLPYPWFDRTSQCSTDELDLLETNPFFNSQTSRLSCQIQLTPELDGMEIRVAPNF